VRRKVKVIPKIKKINKLSSHLSILSFNNQIMLNLIIKSIKGPIKNNKIIDKCLVRMASLSCLSNSHK
jgi:hypothetical protein